MSRFINKLIPAFIFNFIFGAFNDLHKNVHLQLLKL